MKQITIKPCKTCENRGATQDGSPACAKFQILLDNIEEQGCTWHLTTNDAPKCELCGRADRQNMILQTDNRELIICNNCYNNIRTCNTCAYQNECGFRNDHSEPQIINQTVQKGFMLMQAQVKNPHLVEKHCLTCRCSIDDQGTCAKESGGTECIHWVFKS